MKGLKINFSPDWLAHQDKKFKFIEKENSDTLIVCFSGMGSMVKYDFYNTFVNKDICKNIDVIFMVDIKNFFYLPGIEGFSQNSYETVKNLAKICNDKKYKKIYFIGTSMGGYGAVMHALLFPKIESVEKIKCLLFNPLTEASESIFEGATKIFFDDLIFYMQQRGISKNMCYKILLSYDKDLTSLSTMINKFDYQKHNETYIQIIYGNTDKEKNRVKKLINFKNIKMTEYDIEGHNIAFVLSQKKLLDGILEEFLKSS